MTPDEELMPLEPGDPGYQGDGATGAIPDQPQAIPPGYTQVGPGMYRDPGGGIGGLPPTSMIDPTMQAKADLERNNALRDAAIAKGNAANDYETQLDRYIELWDLAQREKLAGPLSGGTLSQNGQIAANEIFGKLGLGQASTGAQVREALAHVQSGLIPKMFAFNYAGGGGSGRQQTDASRALMSRSMPDITRVIEDVEGKGPGARPGLDTLKALKREAQLARIEGQRAQQPGFYRPMPYARPSNVIADNAEAGSAKIPISQGGHMPEPQSTQQPAISPDLIKAEIARRARLRQGQP